MRKDQNRLIDAYLTTIKGIKADFQSLALEADPNWKPIVNRMMSNENTGDELVNG